MHYNKPYIERNRKSIRLKGYDYSKDGAYFVTICTQNRQCVFGNIRDGVFIPNEAGKMVKQVWDESTDFYPIKHGEFVVMPNHVHAIIILENDVGAGPCACPPKKNNEPLTGQPQGVAPTMTLPDVVHRYKTMTTTRYIHGIRNYGWSAFEKRLWQRNYYEHIIRDEEEYLALSDYILNNPKNWEKDKLFCELNP